MNKTLQAFYNAYAAWLDAGAPNGQPFVRDHGLCANLWLWSDRNRGLDMELRNHFIEAQLDTEHPFNDSEDDYFIQSENYECHLNPKRIKWVKDHAQ